MPKFVAQALLIASSAGFTVVYLIIVVYMISIQFAAPVIPDGKGGSHGARENYSLICLGRSSSIYPNTPEACTLAAVLRQTLFFLTIGVMGFIAVLIIPNVGMVLFYGWVIMLSIGLRKRATTDGEMFYLRSWGYSLLVAIGCLVLAVCSVFIKNGLWK